MPMKRVFINYACTLQLCTKSTYKDIFQFLPVALAHNMSKGQLKDKMKYIR